MDQLKRDDMMREFCVTVSCWTIYERILIEWMVITILYTVIRLILYHATYSDLLREHIWWVGRRNGIRG